MTFIRYIGVDFTFGPLDCVGYNEEALLGVLGISDNWYKKGVMRQHYS